MKRLSFNRCKYIFLGIIGITYLGISCICTANAKTKDDNNDLIIKNYSVDSLLTTDYTVNAPIKGLANNIDNYEFKDDSLEVYTNKPDQSLNKKSRTKLKFALSGTGILFFSIALACLSHKAYKYNKEQKRLRHQYGVDI